MRLSLRVGGTTYRDSTQACPRGASWSLFLTIAHFSPSSALFALHPTGSALSHVRIHHVFIPTGACWLNLQEGWWRLFRRDALAGKSFANPKEIEQATRVATAQLNLRVKPWVWGRPPKDHRHYRRLFCYRI